MTTTKPDISALAGATIDLLPQTPVVLSLTEFSTLLNELLNGERGFADAFQAGLLTAEEAGDGVAARVETWLVERGGGVLEHGTWHTEDFASAVADVLRKGGAPA